MQKIPYSAWQLYDTAFCKDAAATGLTNWSKMNPDLNNFHTQAPSLPLTNVRDPQVKSTSSQFGLDHNQNSSQFTQVFVGLCWWPVGRWRFHQACKV